MEAKVVLITGAASGFGAATAKHFVSLGYKNLALVDVDEENLSKIAKECQSEGAKVQELLTDLSDHAATEGVVPRVIEEFGRWLTNLFLLRWLWLHTGDYYFCMSRSGYLGQQCWHSQLQKGPFWPRAAGVCQAHDGHKLLCWLPSGTKGPSVLGKGQRKHCVDFINARY